MRDMPGGKKKSFSVGAREPAKAYGAESGSEEPGKSRAERDRTARLDGGAQLIELPTAVLRALELPERLTDAIIEMGNTRTHEGRRRQMT